MIYLKTGVIIGQTPYVNLTLLSAPSSTTDFLACYDNNKNLLARIIYTGGAIVPTAAGGSLTSSSFDIYANTQTFGEFNTGRIKFHERIVLPDSGTLEGSFVGFFKAFNGSMIEATGTWAAGGVTLIFGWPMVQDTRTIIYSNTQAATACPTFNAQTKVLPNVAVTDTLAVWCGFQSQIKYEPNFSTALAANTYSVCGFEADPMIGVKTGSHASSTASTQFLDGFCAWGASPLSAVVAVGPQSTATNLSGLRISNPNKDAGGTITNQRGVWVNDQTRGTNNYGVVTEVTSGTNKWNLYASGTATNSLVGLTRFGDTTAPDHAIHLVSSLGIKRTQIADANATVASTDAVIAYTSLTAARAVNLQAVATSKADKFLFIKDEVGKSGDFALTLTPSGTEKIDGIATIKLRQDYTSALLYNNGSAWSMVIPPNLVALLDRDDSITTVGPSSTTETTVYSYTVLANTMGKHKTLRYVIQGHMGNSSGANQTMRIRVKWGTDVAYDATHTAPTAATERVFYVMGYISETNSATGQEGTAVSFLGAANTVAGVGAQVQETFCAHHHTLTQNTTSDVNLIITCQLGASNANLQCETHTTQVEIY